MIFYYTIFFIILTIIFVGVITEKYQFKIACVITILISTIASIRDGIGTDFESYQLIFSLAPKLSDLFHQRIQIDLLFWILCSIIKSIGGGDVILFFTTSFLTNFLIFKASYRLYPKYFILPFLVYFCFFMLRFQFNTIRHGIMVSFIWMAFSYIEERNFKKYFLYILLGGGFHILGFLFLPFYWILNKKIKGYSLLLITSILLGLLFNPFKFIIKILPQGGTIYDKFIFYTEVYYANNNSEQGITLGMVVYTLFFLFLSYKKKFFYSLKNGVLLINSLFFALFFAFFFNKYGVFVERITSTFYISLIFLIPIFLYRFPMKLFTRIIFSLLFLCYLILLLNKNLSGIELDGNYQYIPYKTIFK